LLPLPKDDARVPEPDHHAFLCLLAESLASSLAGGGDSVLVHVSPRPDGPDVGILPLDGAAPAEYLLGTVAPPEWSALGVATRGRAGPLSGHGPSSHAEVVVLVPRTGAIVGHLRHGGQVFTEPPAYGLTVDCLQRALQLPTAPPQAPAIQLVATALLEVAISAGDAGPALALLDAGGEWSGFSWERLRQLVAAGHWPDPTLAPEDAAWLDEGAFSRWVLTGRPTLQALLGRVADVAGFAEARRCAGVLQALGLDVGPSSLPARRERRRRRAG
jgi:hypothetical protein